jgi:hypothetical protein
MMTFNYDTITTLPMLLYFVRCVYAIVILIKMHVAVCMPNSELGKLFEPDDLKVEFYMNGLISHFVETGRQRQIKPDKVLRILGVLRDWFEEKHKKGVAAAQRGESYNGDEQQDHGANHGQSGLQMLSQVATGQQQSQSGSQMPTDWTFDRASVMPYARPPHLNNNSSYENVNAGMPPTGYNALGNMGT